MAIRIKSAICQHNQGIFLITPIVLLYLIGLVLPLYVTLERAVQLTWTEWRELLVDPLVLNAAVNTIIDGVVITIISVVLAYAIAGAIWRSTGYIRAILTTLVIIAFLTTVLVKIVAFNALLRDNGVVNFMLMSLHIIDKPIHFFPGLPAVMIGMIQYVLPFAIFPILGSMLKIDQRLEQVAEVLGASPFQVFRRVILPMTLPGVIASSLLVFVICSGFYVIPAMLGTPKDQLLANVIALYALSLVDFKSASGVAIVLVAFVGFLTIFYQKAVRRAN